MQAFKTVDVLKFIFAIFVVCLHVPVTSPAIQAWFEPLFFRLAVPYFFVASGFFLGLKLYDVRGGVNWKVVFGRWLQKLLVFEPINILTTVISMWLTAASLEYIVLSVGRSILFYPWGALWYIQALIVATLILIPFIKKGKETQALFLGVIFYFFALLCNRYFFVVEDTMFEPIVRVYMKVFVSARNGVFMGLMYVAMGIVIAKRWKQKHLNKPYWLSLLLFSSVMLFLEVYYLQGENSLDDGALFISAIFLIPALFVVSAQYNLPLKSSRLFRNLSTSIYLLHCPIIAFCMFLRYLGLDISSYAMLLLTLIMIFVACGLVYPKKKQPYYNWIV